MPFLLLAPFFAIALQRMAIGRRIYALGAGPETARYSGVNGVKIKFVLFVITGVICSIAGIINIGKNSSATPDAAFGFELDAITVVFLGGVSSLGGRGRMTGVYWALLLIMTLRSILQLQGAGGLHPEHRRRAAAHRVAAADQHRHPGLPSHGAPTCQGGPAQGHPLRRGTADKRHAATITHLTGPVPS